MILNKDKFDKSKARDEIECECDFCGSLFLRTKDSIKRSYKIITKDACLNKNCRKSKTELSNIEKYGVKSPLESELIKEKIKKTNIEKYGEENVLKSELVKEKIRKTNIEKYGEENVFKNELIKEKIKKTNIERYGEENVFKNELIKEKIKQTNIRLYGFDYATKNEIIKLKTKKTNLKKYGKEHYILTNDFNERKIKTNLEKYNYTHHSKNEKIKEKTKQTNLKRFGVTCTAQNKQIKEKTKQTNIKKYEKEYPIQNKEIFQKVVNTHIQKHGKFPPNSYGKTQKEIQEWLNSFNYNFKSTFSILNNKEIDLYDENLKIAIEYCGLFWHNENSPQPRFRSYHYDKYKNCSNNNIRLITIFEDEWLNRQNAVKNYLKSVLNVFDKRIYARRCKVQEINKKECNNFLNLNHIQGKVNNIKIAYGIFESEELLGVISLGIHHRNNKDLVLNRLCFKDGVQIVGGSSKLFKHCIEYAKNNNYGKIVSWSDNRWSIGNVYNKLGFILEKELGPDYSYVNKRFRISKQSSKKSNINCPEGVTEREHMLSLGYSRIWDCGKKRWIFNI